MKIAFARTRSSMAGNIVPQTWQCCQSRSKAPGKLSPSPTSRSRHLENQTARYTIRMRGPFCTSIHKFKCETGRIGLRSTFRGSAWQRVQASFNRPWANGSRVTERPCHERRHLKEARGIPKNGRRFGPPERGGNGPWYDESRWVAALGHSARSKVSGDYSASGSSMTKRAPFSVFSARMVPPRSRMMP